MSISLTPQAAVPGVTLTPQGAVPLISVPNTQDYPRLVFGAPYHTTVAIADIIQPSVLEAVQGMLPSLVPPYVQAAANTAVAQLAVQLTGSTMTGPLYLSGLPTQPTQAATKSYVDMMVATGAVPEVPSVPVGQSWARQTGQWVPISQQSGVFLPLTGGTMQGAINMSGNAITGLPAVPSGPSGATSMQWVQNTIAASSLYQGTWNADNNTPDLTQPGTHQNNFSWIATTVSTTGKVVSQPIPGIQGLTVYTGDNLIYSTAAGQFQVIHAGGLSLAEADARYLQLNGGQMSGQLLLQRDPTANMEAATRQWVLTQVASAGIGEAPTDGQIYGRSGLNHNWLAVLPLAGGVLTGALSLSGNATTNLNAVPLQQLTSTVANYVPLTGAVTITGPITMGAAATLTLSGNAGQPLQAVPLQQLTSTLASYVADAPSDSTLYARTNASWQSGGRFSTNLTIGGSSLPADATPGHIYASPHIVPVGANVAWNMYLGSPGWKIIATGYSGLVAVNTSGAMQFIVYPSATAGAALPAPSATMTLNQAGSLTVPTHVLCGAAVYVNYPVVTDFYLSRTSPSRVLSWSANNYNSFNESTGLRAWVAGATTAMSLSSAGVLTTLNNMVSGAGVYAANDTQFGFYLSGTTKIFIFNPSFYWTFNTSNGDTAYLGATTAWWYMRASDALTYNVKTSVGGNGAYVNISDVRGKREIEGVPHGLAEICRLNPIRFRRLQREDVKIENRHELGFSAQDMRKILPEAVMVAGVELADGSGGIDSDEPSLAIAESMIIPVLVNAIKELNQRLHTLERKRA